MSKNISDVVKNIMQINKYLIALVIILVLIIGAITITNKIIPQPVLVVNTEGKYLGILNFANPYLRSDPEIQAGVQQIIHWYYSYNTATIEQDTEMYFRVLSEETLNKRKKQLMTDGIYALVKTTYFQSKVEITEYKIIQRGDMNNFNTWTAQVKVKLTIQGENSNKKSQEFFTNITFTLTMINNHNPTGIRNVIIK